MTTERITGGIDEEVYNWLISSGVKNNQAIMIASSSGVENLTMDSLQILRLLVTDPTGKEILTTVGLEGTGLGGRAKIGDVVTYLASPEGGGWAAAVITEDKEDFYNMLVEQKEITSFQKDRFLDPNYVRTSDETALIEELSGLFAVPSRLNYIVQQYPADVREKQDPKYDIGGGDLFPIGGGRYITPEFYHQQEAELQAKLETQRQAAAAGQVGMATIEKEYRGRYDIYQGAGGRETFDRWKGLGMPDQPVYTQQEIFAKIPFTTEAERGYFTRRFPDIQREFEELYQPTDVGRKRSALEKSQEFGRFIKRYPFKQRYQAALPEERGEYPQRFRPRTRFLNF